MNHNEVSDLSLLLEQMQPVLHDEDYVFCTVPQNYPVDLHKVLGSFKEEEGLTIILEKEEADRLGLTYSFIGRWITLTVHSSLEAVGLTAAFSGVLARAGIACNVVAAFYHDHIFVAKRDAAAAMQVLHQLAAAKPPTGNDY